MSSMIYNTYNKKNIDIACKFLLEGKLIIHSTDTLYGFAADATNDKTILQLNNIKQRIKPLSIIVNSIDMLRKYSRINNQIENKIKKIFPGPFTVILQKNKNNLSSLVSLDLETIGIRIPNNKFILDCINKLQIPLITTSVNIHGQEPLNDLELIKKEYSNFNIFTDEIHRESIGSTIIDYSSCPYRIIRQGDKHIKI